MSFDAFDPVGDRPTDAPMDATTDTGHDAATVVLRPSSATYLTMVRSTPIAFIGFVAIGAVRGGFTGLVLMLCTAGVIALGLWRYFAVARVTVTSDRVERTSFWGRRTRLARDDLGGVLHVPMLVDVHGRTHANLFVLDRAGASVLRMNGMLWATDDMDRLVATLGVRTSVWERPVTPRQVARAHPGAVSWVEAHPWLFGIVGALVVVAFAVAFALATTS